MSKFCRLLFSIPTLRSLSRNRPHPNLDNECVSCCEVFQVLRLEIKSIKPSNDGVVDSVWFCSHQGDCMNYGYFALFLLHSQRWMVAIVVFGACSDTGHTLTNTQSLSLSHTQTHTHTDTHTHRHRHTHTHTKHTHTHTHTHT